MKNLLRLTLSLSLAAASLCAADFRDHLGLQLYSLRAQTKESTTGALDLAKSYGIKEVELAGTGSLKPEQFAAELKSRGLVPVAGHFAYALFEKDTAVGIKGAKTPGLVPGRRRPFSRGRRPGSSAPQARPDDLRALGWR